MKENKEKSRTRGMLAPFVQLFAFNDERSLEESHGGVLPPLALPVRAVVDIFLNRIAVDLNSLTGGLRGTWW